MYFTDDSLLPQNQTPLMITAAPYGPMWMPPDCTPEQNFPVAWNEQVQVANHCFNAGATLLHVHVRDPKTGHVSKNFKEYSEQAGRLRHAVPKMILQVGGPILAIPEPGEKAGFANYDSRFASYPEMILAGKIWCRSTCPPRKPDCQRSDMQNQW